MPIVARNFNNEHRIEVADDSSSTSRIRDHPRARYIDVTRSISVAVHLEPSAACFDQSIEIAGDATVQEMAVVLGG